MRKFKTLSDLENWLKEIGEYRPTLTLGEIDVLIKAAVEVC